MCNLYVLSGVQKRLLVEILLGNVPFNRDLNFKMGQVKVIQSRL